MTFIHKDPRTGLYRYRRKLPSSIAGQPAPDWLPASLSALRNSQKGKANTFIATFTQSLATKDRKQAIRAFAPVHHRVEGLFAEAVKVMEAGQPMPPATTTPAHDEAWLDHQARLYHRNELAQDQADRDAFDRSSPAQHAGEIAAHGDLLTEDLEASRAAIIGGTSEARHSAHAQAVKAHLRSQGVTQIDRASFDKLASRIAEADTAALEDRARRQSGQPVPTPPLPKAPPTGPLLSEAFAAWINRTHKPPRHNTIIEAGLAVRWFIDLHGNLPVLAIGSRHVRDFRDKTAKAPGKPTHAQRKLALPALLTRSASHRLVEKEAKSRTSP